MVISISEEKAFSRIHLIYMITYFLTMSKLGIKGQIKVIYLKATASVMLSGESFKAFLLKSC